MSDLTATRNALLSAIATYFEEQNPQKGKFNLRKHLIKTYKVDTPQSEIEHFTFALYHGHKNLREKQYVAELFQMLSLEATGLEQVKGKTQKTPKRLIDYVFDALNEVAGHDVLSRAALNALRPATSFKSIANWQQFAADYRAKRAELEAIADTVFELAGVTPGDTDALEGVLVNRFKDYIQTVGDLAFDWGHWTAWNNAHHNLSKHNLIK